MPTDAEILTAEIAAHDQAIAQFDAQIAQAEITIRLAKTLRTAANDRREWLVAKQSEPPK